MTARVQASVVPGSARAWVLACRPATLPASVVPVAVGTAVAHAAGGLRPWAALAALVGALLLQIGSNLANDVFDHEKGADTPDRLGPTRAVAAGLLDASAVRRAMAVVFGLALAVGAYLVSVAGPVIVIVGLSAIVAAIAYTGGPYPLGYHGLGDVFVMLFFGFVAVVGTAFVQTGAVLDLAVWAAVPVGSLATAILVVNNLRDRETDRAAGKRTLAVRLGRSGAVIEYVLLQVAAFGVPVVLAVRGAGPWMLAPLVALPLAARNVADVARLEGSPLNATLVATARELVVFGAALTLGVALGAGS